MLSLQYVGLRHISLTSCSMAASVLLTLGACLLLYASSITGRIVNLATRDLHARFGGSFDIYSEKCGIETLVDPAYVLSLVCCCIALATLVFGYGDKTSASKRYSASLLALCIAGSSAVLFDIAVTQLEGESSHRSRGYYGQLGCLDAYGSVNSVTLYRIWLLSTLFWLANLVVTNKSDLIRARIILAEVIEEVVSEQFGYYYDNDIGVRVTPCSLKSLVINGAALIIQWLLSGQFMLVTILGTGMTRLCTGSAMLYVCDGFVLGSSPVTTLPGKLGYSWLISTVVLGHHIITHSQQKYRLLAIALCLADIYSPVEFYAERRGVLSLFVALFTHYDVLRSMFCCRTQSQVIVAVEMTGGTGWMIYSTIVHYGPTLVKNYAQVRDVSTANLVIRTTILTASTMKMWFTLAKWANSHLDGRNRRFPSCLRCNTGRKSDMLSAIALAYGPIDHHRAIYAVDRYNPSILLRLFVGSKDLRKDLIRYKSFRAEEFTGSDSMVALQVMDDIARTLYVAKLPDRVARNVYDTITWIHAVSEGVPKLKLNTVGGGLAIDGPPTNTGIEGHSERLIEGRAEPRGKHNVDLPNVEEDVIFSLQLEGYTCMDGPIAIMTDPTRGFSITGNRATYYVNGRWLTLGGVDGGADCKRKELHNGAGQRNTDIAMYNVPSRNSWAELVQENEQARAHHSLREGDCTIETATDEMVAEDNRLRMLFVEWDRSDNNCSGAIRTDATDIGSLTETRPDSCSEMEYGQLYTQNRGACSNYDNSASGKIHSTLTSSSHQPAAECIITPGRPKLTAQARVAAMGLEGDKTLADCRYLKLSDDMLETLNPTRVWCEVSNAIIPFLTRKQITEVEKGEKARQKAADHHRGHAGGSEFLVAHAGFSLGQEHDVAALDQEVHGLRITDLGSEAIQAALTLTRLRPSERIAGELVNTEQPAQSVSATTTQRDFERPDVRAEVRPRVSNTGALVYELGTLEGCDSDGSHPISIPVLDLEAPISETHIYQEANGGEDVTNVEVSWMGHDQLHGDDSHELSHTRCHEAKLCEDQVYYAVTRNTIYNQHHKEEIGVSEEQAGQPPSYPALVTAGSWGVSRGHSFMGMTSNLSHSRRKEGMEVGSPASVFSSIVSEWGSCVGRINENKDRTRLTTLLKLRAFKKMECVNRNMYSYWQESEFVDFDIMDLSLSRGPRSPHEARVQLVVLGYLASGGKYKPSLELNDDTESWAEVGEGHVDQWSREYPALASDIKGWTLSALAYAERRCHREVRRLHSLENGHYWHTRERRAVVQEMLRRALDLSLDSMASANAAIWARLQSLHSSGSLASSRKCVHYFALVGQVETADDVAKTLQLRRYVTGSPRGKLYNLCNGCIGKKGIFARTRVINGQPIK